MKLIAELESKLKSIGGSLDNTGYTLNCDAPVGYVWNANSCTCIAIHYATNSQQWLAKALREDGYQRLRLGLRKVVDETELASVRHDLDDDNWGAPSDAPETIEWPSGAGKDEKI